MSALFVVYRSNSDGGTDGTLEPVAGGLRFASGHHDCLLPISKNCGMNEDMVLCVCERAELYLLAIILLQLQEGSLCSGRDHLL